MTTTRRRRPAVRAACAFWAASLAVLPATAAGWAADKPSAAADAPVAAASAKPDDGTVSKKKPVSPIAMVNLINTMVEEKLISEEKGAALIKQAEDEAYVARQAVKDAAAKTDEASQAANKAAAAAMPPGTKRVAYVPEVVKRELREEIKKEVMEKAQQENWASPGAYPEWASRIRFSGDIRARWAGTFFPGGNADGGNFPNFNAINTGNPYDTSKSNPNLFPAYDTDQNRNQFQLRARLGAEADLSNSFTADVRIGTGQSSSPVSENQTLGASGGDFSKYGLWLDRGYIRYRPIEQASLEVGRFDNPFFSPTDLVWNKDIGFDGVAAEGHYELAKGFTPFVVVGAFPVFNTDFNYATNQATKLSSQDRYLFAGQVGAEWKPTPEIAVKLGAAFYDFTDIQGRLSDPCVVNNASDVCDTDALRPSFAQLGNTYMALRDIVSNSANSYGTTSQYQYYGLASAFRDLALTGQVDLSYFNPVHVIFDGEYVRNLAFDRSAIGAIAVNNRAGTSDGTTGAFAGGATGWYVRMTVGDKELKAFGDWNVNVGYKYVESDAVVDAFTDSDFGLGGTNVKGYTVGANYALGKNVWTSVRWVSANAVAGPPLAVDVLRVDLNAKF